jgi:hypothetical protein
MLHISLLFTEAFFTTHAENSPRTTYKRASVSPINPWSDTRENRPLLLLRHFGTRGGHVINPHSFVIQVFITVAWQRERLARRGGGARRDSARHGRARFGTEKTPLRLLCVVPGTYFEVSVTQQFLHGANTPQYIPNYPSYLQVVFFIRSIRNLITDAQEIPGGQLLAFIYLYHYLWLFSLILVMLSRIFQLHRLCGVPWF